MDKRRVKWLQDVVRAMRVVFAQPLYVAVALGVALAIVLVAVWAPQVGLLKVLFREGEVYSTFDKIRVLKEGVFLLASNFTALTRAITILLAILSGIHTSLFVFYLRQRRHGSVFSSGGTMGSFLGILGTGCTSCGSVILSFVVGFSASTGIIATLPFQGAEFGVVGIVIITASLFFLARNIQHSPVCRVHTSGGKH